MAYLILTGAGVSELQPADPVPHFVNEVLLGHSHTNSFTYCLFAFELNQQS